jgi:hypothetical protein
VEVTDAGEAHWLLGIEMKRDREARTISLLQHAYIESIIHHFNFDELKPISTPIRQSTSALVGDPDPYPRGFQS